MSAWLLPPAYVVGLEVIFSLCPLPGGRGYPSPRFFHCSLVPGPFRGGGGERNPVLGSFPGFWSQVFSERVIYLFIYLSWTRYPSGQIRMGYSPPRSGWDTPLARSGWGTPLRQNNRVAVCLLLAFTQENFPV